MIKLKGLTWDHPRGYDSIVAATKLFEQSSANIQLSWHKRSLKEFGDQSLEEFINEYDLLMIDHPFVGEAHQNKHLMRLDLLLPDRFLKEQSKMHIGNSFESYRYQNHQYALPIDASAQFSAFHKPSISANELPRTWDHFLEMMTHKSFSKQVVWPLCPTDLWCSFLTISAQIAGKNNNIFNAIGLQQDVAQKALDFLKSVSPNVSEDSWKLNPIQALELMKSGKYSYAPLLFGYISYSQNGSAIHFINALSLDPEQPISLLGGVGMALSASSRYKKECAEFMQFVLRDEVLSGSYAEYSGQPSLVSSWKSKILNEESENFYMNTMASMANSYVRPRIPGFNKFQEDAAHCLHDNLRKVNESQLTTKLNHLFTKYCL